MEQKEISFENLPNAVAHLNNQVEELKEPYPSKRIGFHSSKENSIDIDRALRNYRKSKTDSLYIGENSPDSVLQKWKETLFFRR